MSTVTSADGTTIAFTRAGQGPALILVDGALCSRSFGPMPKLAAQLTPRFTVYTCDRHGGPVLVHGTSSGAALALEAVKRIPAITKLAVYEPPFIVDGSRSPIPDGYLAELSGLVASGRRGDAVKMFMRFVGTPAIFTAVMPLTPVWPKPRVPSRRPCPTRGTAPCPARTTWSSRRPSRPYSPSSSATTARSDR